MRQRIWLIVLFALIALFAFAPQLTPNLEEMTENDSALRQALVQSPENDRGLQLWLGGKSPFERLQLGMALLRQDFHGLPENARRALGWNLAAVCEWDLGDRGMRDEMLNSAMYVLVAHRAPPHDTDLVRAESISTAFINAVERQKKESEAWRRFRDTEACYHFVNGNHRTAERIWLELLDEEETEELRDLYQSRLEAAQAEATLIPLEDFSADQKVPLETTEETAPQDEPAPTEDVDHA